MKKEWFDRPNCLRFIVTNTNIYIWKSKKNIIKIVYSIILQIAFIIPPVFEKVNILNTI